MNWGRRLSSVPLLGTLHNVNSTYVWPIKRFTRAFRDQAQQTPQAPLSNTVNLELGRARPWRSLAPIAGHVPQARTWMRTAGIWERAESSSTCSLNRLRFLRFRLTLDSKSAIRRKVSNLTPEHDSAEMRIWFRIKKTKKEHLQIHLWFQEQQAW